MVGSEPITHSPVILDAGNIDCLLCEDVASFSLVSCALSGWRLLALASLAPALGGGSLLIAIGVLMREIEGLAQAMRLLGAKLTAEKRVIEVFSLQA